jgi:hypothetical protein
MQIEFNPTSLEVENLVQPPKPAKNSIPDWYKKIPTFNKKLEFDDLEPSAANVNLKHCMPFLDALNFGYIQETWVEIHIKKVNNTIEYRYATTPEIINHRDLSHFSISNKYVPIELVWKNVWMPKTPKGYSVLITHPLNRYDLPFITTSGVIDSDNFNTSVDGNIPFYIEEGFEGIIPVGTPMYQIIPFKRTDWNSRKNKLDIKNNEKTHFEIRKRFTGSYKNFMWERKRFN